ncbi:MAG: phosphatidylglycerol lysyltransferase domain-containing protein [Candidatus Saccharimonadales bacterium]
MQLLTAEEIVRLSKASVGQLETLRTLASPSSCSALPSILRLWYDYDDACEFFLMDSAAFLLLNPFREDAYWSASGRVQGKDEWHKFSTFIESRTINELSLLSEESKNAIVNYSPNSLVSDNDPGLYDYIYDVDMLVACKGPEFRHLRRQVSTFFKIYGPHTKIHVHDDLAKLSKKDVIHLFNDWLSYGTDGASSPEAEEYALDKLFLSDSQKYFGKLQITELRYKSHLVGFSVCELPESGFAVNHFQKCNLNLTGISYYLFYASLEHLQRKDIKFLNYQEDNNIPGLRQFKEGLRPAKVNKNYLLTL